MTDDIQGRQDPGADSPLGEFGRIREFFAPLTDGHPGSFDLLDDAAVLSVPAGQELVVTMDSIVRGIHYLDRDTPEEIAGKLLRVNLSDLASKGAAPLAYSLSVALPGSVTDSWVASFAGQLAADQAEFGIRLLGGDSVRTTGPETFTVTAYGLVPAGQMVRRGGARAGEKIYVTGTIGDGALGLLAAKGAFGMSDAAEFLSGRYRFPVPRMKMGLGLRGLAGGGMDVSDGLVGDLAAMCRASGAGAVLYAPRVPLSNACAEILATDPGLFETVLTGGDDYELLFTIPAEKAGRLDTLARDAGIAVTRIGEITDNLPVGQVDVLDAEGEIVPLSQQKFSHA